LRDAFDPRQRRKVTLKERRIRLFNRLMRKSENV